MKTHERRLATLAGERLIDELSERFPDFRFRLQVQLRRDLGETRREESSRLLREAAEARTVHAWDFALLMTADELIARRRSFAFAALSRPLDAAIVSTSRVVPGPDAGTDEATVLDRLATLCLHAIAHLGGLATTRDCNGVLFHPATAADLDGMSRFSDREHAELAAALHAIADERLEERASNMSSRWRFTARAAWINREEIVEAVIAARPWEFPQRLSRLTTAALSTLALLLMTAESWDLGLSQGGGRIVLMALAVLLATTLYVVTRQQLLMRRHHELREQLVVTRVSALLIVLAGLAITWLGIAALALLAGITLFDADLVAAWAASNQLSAADIGIGTATKMAGFCASIGLLIGSLGASFEDQHHFQHVIFVDEEL